MKLLSVTIDPKSPEQGLHKVIELLRPEWKDHVTDDVSFVPQSGGVTNSIVCCHLETDLECNDALIVRIAPRKDNVKQYFGATRDEIALNCQVLEAAGCALPLVALFENGSIMKYAPGKHFDEQLLKNDRIMRRVFQLVAGLHCLDLDKLSLVDSKGEPVDTATLDRTPTYLVLTRVALSFIPEPGKDTNYPKDDFFTKENLSRELERVEVILNILNMNVVFSHGDCQPRNLIYNETTDDIKMIDMDMSGFNYEIHDIVTMHQTRYYYDTLANKAVTDLSEEHLYLWVKFYLEAKAEVLGKSPEFVSQRDIDMKYTACKIHCTLFHFCIMMWGLGNITNPDLALDPAILIKLAKLGLEKYQEGKKTIDSLLNHYTNLQNKL